MTVPAVATYSIAALAAAHTAFKGLIDAGAGAGSIKIRSAADVLLAQIPLSKPCGAVSGSTGQMAFAMAGRDESADASGAAAYGEFCDSAGLVHLSMPAQAGTTPVSGCIIINTLSVVAGGPVAVVSATIG